MQGGIPTIIPQQILQLKQIFGINTTVSNSLCLLSTDRIFYVAGYYGVVYNPKQKEKSQSYYPGAQGCKNISSICISPNRKFMAMGMRSEDRPCLYYYQLNASAKRRKIQFTQNFAFTSWVSAAFTYSDTKNIASITNKNANGQALLVFWNPQRGKCQAQLKITGHEQKDFTQILFNPTSESQVVSILGEKTFKVFQLKQNIEEKKILVEELQTSARGDLTTLYTLNSHMYLNTSQQILVLAQQATLIIDYKAEITQTIQETGQISQNWSEGFVVAGNSIKIFRFEQNKYKLKYTHQFLDKQLTVCLISVFDDKLLIVLSNGCMMQGKIKFQPTKDTVKFQCQNVGLPYHSAPIIGMDICIRKPLIATASKDKTIKIWNYQERTVQTPKAQAQAASCLSFHPSGLHLAVAYSDKLRIMNLQKDGQSMSNFKDINSFRNCNYIKFSNGGQYFAAASGNLVHIFKFYTGQNPPGMTFSGHSGKIKCMAWNKQDNILVTCGTDGIILAYRIGMQNCGLKLLYIHSSKQPRTKGVSYSSIAINADNTIYAMGMVGNNGQRIFKQIKLDGTDNKRQLAQNTCSQIIFPSTGRILFCGTDDKQHTSGSIKCYKFPSTQHMQEFQAHDNNGVQKLCVTFDDKYLVTAGKDGCIMIFEIRDKQARSDKLKQTLPISNQILITKSDLNALKSQIDNLKQEKNELEGINITGSIKDDQVKQLKDKYSSDQSQFQQKYNAIIEKKNLLKKKFDEEIRTKKQEFENSLQQFDSNQAKNVMQQSAKYDQLKRAQQEELVQFQKQINKTKLENQREIRKLEEDYHEKIKNLKDQKTNIKKKIQRLTKQHDETMRQINQQKTQQVSKLENQHAQQVQNITQASLRAKSDVSIAKKRISQKQQDRQKHIEKQRQNKDEIERLEKDNQTLQKEIEHQTILIQQRDKTIDSNERKIYQYKKKSQELQKFKYVLDHKIKQLKKDIAPRQQQIAKMKAQTNKMDKQLKDLNSLNTGLAQFVAELFKNQQSLKKKIAAQRARISFQNNKIQTFKDALYQTAQLIQNEQELKKSSDDLQRKFVSQSMTQVKMDSQIENQYKNQKKYLQKSIAMLRKNLQKDNDIHKHENIRIMKDNVNLIKSISSLRLEIREDNQKKGNEDEKKGKNQPKEQQLRNQILSKRQRIQFMKRQVEDLQQRINDL